MIEIHAGEITKFVKKNQIDVVVNAANPTLMGSKEAGVDYEIHKMINKDLSKGKKFKDKIREELDENKNYPEELIRCERGKAVTTSGYNFCKYVIHVVGPKCDGKKKNKKKPWCCTSHCTKILEICYRNIMNQVKNKREIKTVAISIIGSGNYGIPFEVAVRIAIGTVGNVLTEWKNEDLEYFQYMTLEKITFCIYDSDVNKQNEFMNIGNKVLEQYDMSLGDLKEESAKRQNPLQAVIKALSDVFIGIMPALLAAALLMGITSVLGGLEVVKTHDTLYAINRLVSLASTGIFAILPMAVCYSAVKRFGGNPVLGMVIGAIMLDSSLANAYQAAQGTVDVEVIRLFGLKIEMVGFQGGIIIALMMGFVVAKLDKFFNKVIPDVIKLLVAPMLTVFISTVLLFTLVGPAGRILSNGITDGLMWSTEHLGAFGYALFAGVQQIVVITGLHHIIGAVEAQLIASTGTNFLNPLMSVALFGQSGAVLGYLSLNWKNLKARELCIPSFCSTLFGISEPAIFGVNLRYKFPLIGGCIGGAVAGAYVYYSKLTALGFGTTALPGMAIANPAHHGYINYIIAHAIAITIGFVCTVIFGKMWSAPDKNKNDKKNDTKENDTTKAVITEEPGAVYAAAEGTVKDIEASTDPTFANKVLGDGVVIFPEDGTVMAPCKATVSLVYPTGHAIGLTTADGAEILIHCGVDTVNMNGEGFETLVKEGQEVTAEEALIRFDIDLVKKHGYSPEILVIFTELPEGKTIKTEEKHIAKNDKMAEIV